MHCEILMAGRQMGVIGMSLYAGFIGVIFIGGDWVRRHSRNWPAVRDLGWTYEVQAVAFAVGGFFSPSPWNPVMLMLAGSVSALVRILREEETRQMERLTGI